MRVVEHARNARRGVVAKNVDAVRESSIDFPPGAAQTSATTAPVGTHAYCATSVEAGSWM
jgi:hypothetical protein